jgi:hypothetical protein
MPNGQRFFWAVMGAMVIAGITVIFVSITTPHPSDAVAASPNSTDVNTQRDYIVLAWNDLGMHCYNRDFRDLAVLPPANTLWAQVVKVGSPPQVITTGVTVEYSFAANTYSIGKSNFWDTSPYTNVQNAYKMFSYLGIPNPLPPNVGITGNGLAGQMAAKSDHFVAEYIPITEYDDSDWTARDPYQLATIIVRDAATQAELARETVVTPVSTEMRCDRCHSDGQREGIATGRVETNILALHDQEEDTHLMDNRPVLCASCHASNAIFAPGSGEAPNLSRAMHDQHQDVVTQDTNGCYNCHPGPLTQCLRDVMSQQGMTCVNCHGTMDQVSLNPTPWLHEPRCDTCHVRIGAGGVNDFQQNQALYRMSSSHGGIYCEGCHDSTHAIAPSSQPRDALKFIDLQGHTGKLDLCTVCHSTWPTGPGPHGVTPPRIRTFSFAPDQGSTPDPGATVIYTHTLHNTGNVTDTYQIQWSSSQGWASVNAASPLTLNPAESGIMTVTVNVPNTSAVRGLTDTTIITASSIISPTNVLHVTDITMVPRSRNYLPLMMK